VTIGEDVATTQTYRWTVRSWRARSENTLTAWHRADSQVAWAATSIVPTSRTATKARQDLAQLQWTGQRSGQSAAGDDAAWTSGHACRLSTTWRSPTARRTGVLPASPSRRARQLSFRGIVQPGTNDRCVKETKNTDKVWLLVRTFWDSNNITVMRWPMWRGHFLCVYDHLAEMCGTDNRTRQQKVDCCLQQLHSVLKVHRYIQPAFKQFQICEKCWQRRAENSHVPVSVQTVSSDIRQPGHQCPMQTSVFSSRDELL